MAALAFGVGGSSSTVARGSTVAAGSAVRQRPLTRYSLAHSCYSLRSRTGGKTIAPTVGPFRMQPAALGIYLLYGRRGDYLIDGGGGALQSMSAPSTAAEWRVDGSSKRGFTITDLATGSRLRIKFVTAKKCATYPEAQVDARGAPAAGASPSADVLGTVEGHAHVTAFEFIGGDFHCGRPWSAFGAPTALPADCSPYQVGANGQFEAFLDFGGGTRPSDMHGWPTFKEWPSPTALVEEGDYYTGIERAWRAGLRVMVNQLVDNEALCSVMTKSHNPCNDMASVHIQSRDLYALQDYIDAQSGGPGKGWFRIVTDPFQARRIINAGKLAVIEGIEVSRIFGCGEVKDVPQCDTSQINAGLKEVHALGVRTFFPVHEFDNALGGTKGISGSAGAIVNAGNQKETGSFWDMQSCPAQQQDAQQTTVGPAGPLAQLLNGPFASLAHGSVAPVYPSGPTCNSRGLTSLGTYAIGQMIKQHFLIQTDHMSSKAATTAVSIATARHYSGVVSAHCCSSPQLFKQIYATGGVVNPPVESAMAFVSTWKTDKALHAAKYHFGFGWGSDENGLGGQPGPSTEAPISYPFKSYDGRVTFRREQWGQRTFDLNTDGLANYGMYADWLRDVQLVGGRPIMADMFQGAEAYLEMWERAVGVKAMSCRPASERFTSAGLGRAIRLGDTTTVALNRAGQPLARPGRSYRYCISGRSSRGSATTAVFDGRGRIAMIASTATGDSAAGVAPGASAGRLGSRIRQLLPGLWVGPNLRGGAQYVYGVRGGHVRFVALTTAAVLRSSVGLRSDLRAAGL